MPGVIALAFFLAQRTLFRDIRPRFLVAWYNWVDMKKKIVLGVILVVLVVAACLSVGVMLNWRNNTNSAMQDNVASRNDAEDFASGGGVVAEDNTTGENAGSANIEVKDLAEIAKEDGKVNIYFFWGDGCAHCAAAFKFFASIREEYGKYYNLYTFETWFNDENAKLAKVFAEKMGDTVKGVPYIIIGERSFIGFGAQDSDKLVQAIEEQRGGEFDVYWDRVR